MSGGPVEPKAMDSTQWAVAGARRQRIDDPNDYSPSHLRLAVITTILS